MKKRFLIIIPIMLLLLLLFILLLNTGSKKSIVGKWKSVDKENEYFFYFNDDKTCSYEMKVARLGCTYEDDGKKITILYKGTDQSRTYEYHFEEEYLIISDDSNNNKFIKQN